MPAPLRSVKDNLLISEQRPAIRLRINSSFRYVGGLSFILYDLAEVEQHHFVIADEQQHVQRLVWIQFEGYLDNNDHRYDYPLPNVLTLARYDFLHDANVLNIEADYQEHPSSDGAHVVDFLKANGCSLAGDMMSKRLVWLAPDKRYELMIIYLQDLQLIGYRVGELTKNGIAADHWPALARDLHEHALASFTVLGPETGARPFDEVK